MLIITLRFLLSVVSRCGTLGGLRRLLVLTNMTRLLAVVWVFDPIVVLPLSFCGRDMIWVLVVSVIVCALLAELLLMMTTLLVGSIVWILVMICLIEVVLPWVGTIMSTCCLIRFLPLLMLGCLSRDVVYG